MVGSPAIFYPGWFPSHILPLGSHLSPWLVPQPSSTMVGSSAIFYNGWVFSRILPRMVPQLSSPYLLLWLVSRPYLFYQGWFPSHILPWSGPQASSAYILKLFVYHGLLDPVLTCSVSEPVGGYQNLCAVFLSL